MSSKRTRKDLTLKQKLEIIKCVEGGAKHSAVAIANSFSRSTVTKVIQNKKKLMDALMVCLTDDFIYFNSRDRSPHPPRGTESAFCLK